MKILQSKILLAILACLIVLVGIGGYFYKEAEAKKAAEIAREQQHKDFEKNFKQRLQEKLEEKQHQAEVKKYFTEEIDDETKAVMQKNLEEYEKLIQGENNK